MIDEDGERRVAQAHAALAHNPLDPQAYIAAARYCKQLGRLHETLDILKLGIERCASSAAIHEYAALHEYVALHEYYIERLEKCNRTEEAIGAARDAMQRFPDEWIFRLREALLLPIFYDSPEQLECYHRRFTEGLHRVIREVPLDTPADQQRACIAIGKHINKYLGYQGRNTLELQRMYGAWVHRIMAANYPQWVRSLPMPSPDSGGRLRVGYVSARFRNISVTKAFLGWLRERAPEQAKVFAYHVSDQIDAITDQVRRASDTFEQVSDTLDQAVHRILADHLHILVFLDIGMDPRMTQLAALRLAPVQCMTWDYPVTSGLPTLDYFLSSELMEPPGAQDHYSETLVSLPGIGICYSKPTIPTVLLRKSRRDFGLREDSVVYLSCQSVFKYLPSQDALFAQIARRVPGSQFVFLRDNDVVTADFRKRLERTFAAAGLEADEYCVLLPHQNTVDYLNLNVISDVFLDTIGWSGGVTALEAIACKLPIVTLPGSLMRARHSYGILTQLGITETISQNEGEYIEIAVRLGLDRSWRDSVVRRMVENYPQLYSDTRSIRALEEFYQRVVREFPS